MQLMQATAAVVVAAAAAAAVVLGLPPASASVGHHWPEDAKVVRYCIARSCGHVPAPDTMECWTRCLEVLEEEEEEEEMGQRVKIELELELEEEEEELELGEGEQGVDQEMETGEREPQMTNRKRDGNVLFDPIEGEGKAEQEEGVGHLGADGLLRGLVLTGVSEVTKADWKEGADGTGAFGVLPGPVLTGVAEELKTDTHRNAGDFDPVGIRYGHPRSRPRRGSTVSGGSVSRYAQAILDQHNSHRANHSAPVLTWSNGLAKTAQQIGESCVYEHNTGVGDGEYGQNIGAGASPDAVPALLTNDMYNGEIDFFPLPYGQAQPDMSEFEEWGHFSQMVWKSTTEVGCATVDCSASGLADTDGSEVAPWFTVCNYSPPGNYDGEYGKNIAEPKDDAVVVLANVPDVLADRDVVYGPRVYTTGVLGELGRNTQGLAR